MHSSPRNLLCAPRGLASLVIPALLVSPDAAFLLVLTFPRGDLLRIRIPLFILTPIDLSPRGRIFSRRNMVSTSHGHSLVTGTHQVSADSAFPLVLTSPAPIIIVRRLYNFVTADRVLIAWDAPVPRGICYALIADCFPSLLLYCKLRRGQLSTSFLHVCRRLKRNAESL